MGSNLLAPYSYYLDESTGLYHFDTDNYIDFTVYFALDSSWFPDNLLVSENVYSFGFWTSDPGKFNDPKIRITIVKILEAHFERNKDSVLTYLCDDHDNKQIYRKRKFNAWFLGVNSHPLIKFDKEVVYDGQLKYSSILIHEGNKHFQLIVDAYLKGEMDVTSKFQS